MRQCDRESSSNGRGADPSNRCRFRNDSWVAARTESDAESSRKNTKSLAKKANSVGMPKASNAAALGPIAPRISPLPLPVRTHFRG